MQYLFTQAEFDSLLRTSKLRTIEEKKQLQDFCTLAAQYIPVPVPGMNGIPAEVWGCILGPTQQNPGYCDLCPARKVCPCEEKEWSQ